jgi:hypothetical protein
MNAQEIRTLQEAYLSVYQPQYINEEVEIATEYFYEMGLNEHGIDILIEELGVEEFVEWVDEIAEEYTLNEATRLQKKAAEKDRILIGPKGSKPQSTTKAREKAQGGVTMKSSEAPKSTISARKRATKAAAENQPETQETPEQEKKGIGGRIGAAFKFVKDRAAKDTELLGKSIQTAKDVATRRGAEAKAVYDAVRERGKKVEQSPEATRARRKATVALGRGAQAAGRTAIKAAGAAGAATGEGIKAKRQGKTGAQIAGRVVGTLVKKMSAEEYNYILSHLLDEGYANDLHGAEVILVNMSEDWTFEVLDEAAKDQSDKQIEKGVKTTYKAGNVLDNTHQGRSPGLNKLPAGERAAKTKRMRGRLNARRDDLFQERGNREDAKRAELKKLLGL